MFDTVVQITVIGYSANHFVTPRKMGFCFDRYKLAKATLPSQALLQKFVEALSINGSSHYETALEKIFSFINQPVDHGYKGRPLLSSLVSSSSLN